MQLEIVNQSKLLGLNLSSDLKWNIHISEIVKKTASKLYFLRQLKRSKVAGKELTQSYTTCIRPITEYAYQVYHKACLIILAMTLNVSRNVQCTLSIQSAVMQEHLMKLASNHPLKGIRSLRQSSSNRSPPIRIIDSTLFSQK